MKNLAKENFNVIAAIEAGNEELLQKYINAVLELEQQCRVTEDSLNQAENTLMVSASISYQVKFSLFLHGKNFTCNSASEIFFVLLVAAVQFQQGNLIPLLLSQIKNINNKQAIVLLFGTVFLAVPDKDKTVKENELQILNNIFATLFERFAEELGEGDIFELVASIVCYSLHTMLQSFLSLYAEKFSHSKDIINKQKRFGHNNSYFWALQEYGFSSRFLAWNRNEYRFFNLLYIAAVNGDMKSVNILLAAGANNLILDHPYNGKHQPLSVIKCINDDSVLAVFLQSGFGVFERFNRVKLKTILNQTNIGKVILFGCTVIDKNKSLESKDFEHPAAITTIDQLKSIPINSEDDIKLFKRWYISIDYAQTELLSEFIEDAEKRDKLWDEAERWKFEIMRSISRRSAVASLSTHCLFAVKHGVFKNRPMQRLGRLNLLMLAKLSRFPHANSQKAKRQFFQLVWNDYLANCDNKNINELDIFIEKLSVVHDEQDEEMQNFIWKIYNIYKTEIKSVVFKEVVLVQLKNLLLKNMGKEATQRDQQLFINTLTVLQIAEQKFDEETEKGKMDKIAWIKNLDQLFDEPANYQMLYFLVRESNVIDFKSISIREGMKSLFALTVCESSISNKIISFFKETIGNVLTVAQIQHELKSFQRKFNDIAIASEKTFSN